MRQTKGRTELLCLALLLVLAVGAAAVFVRAPSRPRPCRATFERVAAGMTRGEVIATVGGPPGSYTAERPALDTPPYRPWSFHEEWLADDGLLLVRYDGGRVEKTFLITDLDFPPRPSFFQRVRDWLGL